jgi:omega-6 fatty acid desaturase (delta-12 desaturase)
MGVWLFFVQHQFEDVYWESAEDWSYVEAALRGSSHLKLPKLLQFFTGNIGLHHVHHLSVRVPNYNLQAAHDDLDVFKDVPTLTMGESLRCSRLKLIDDSSGRLLTWAQARAVVTPPLRQPSSPAS